MKVSIEKFVAHGEVTAPPSKSMAHRLLVCGAMSEKSVIKNVSFSQDILATLDAVKALGATVSINGDEVVLGKMFKGEIAPTFCCRESGSTLRFLIPIALLSGEKITLTGSERLFERDLSAYEEFFKDNGFLFEKGENSLTVFGKLKSGEYCVDASKSSQFVSGLLFALSFLEGESRLNLKGKVESKPYIDLTISALRDFGVDVFFESDTAIKIKSGGVKKREIAVEGDWSNAVFFDALNFLGGDVKVKGLREDSLQGDRIYKQYFSRLGKEVIDLSHTPDLAPIMFALAAVVGKCEFVGTKRLKIKESDRASAMKEELSKLGVKVLVGEDSVTVFGGEIQPPTQPINSHNDHRIVMAMSVLLTRVGGEIEGAEAVKKSFPDFFEHFLKLQGK